jgi:hypothetical protein
MKKNHIFKIFHLNQNFQPHQGITTKQTPERIPNYPCKFKYEPLAPQTKKNGIKKIYLIFLHIYPQKTYY